MTTIYNFKVHEFHRYITLTGHIFGVTLLLCNAEIYGTWPYDVTDAVEAAAQEATRTQRELATAEDKDVLAKLDPDQNEIIHLTAAERAAFVDAVTPLLNDYRDKLGPNIFGTFD